MALIHSLSLFDMHLGSKALCDGWVSSEITQLTETNRFHSWSPYCGTSEYVQKRSNPVFISLLSALTDSSTVCGMALACQQMAAILIKRFHHSRRDWKGLISQILLPVLFVLCAMGLGSIKNDLRHYAELELSPALYKFDPSYSFFR